MPLMGASPLCRGIRWRDELRHNLAGGTPGRLIQRIEIFPNGATRPRQLGPIDVIRARKRALLVGVSGDQTGIDGEAFTTDQAFSDRPLHHNLEQVTESVTVANASMTGLGEGRV